MADDVTLALSGALSEDLKEATAVAHERAETSVFIDELLSGRLGAEDFGRLTGQLYFIYSALEATGDALADDPVAGAIVDERLRRVPSLIADLQSLGADPAELTPLPEVADYVAAIESSVDDPARYVAHHYTRYLGDLSGGQVLAHKMREHYGLGPDTLSFYNFAAIEKIKPYRDGYRERLDTLPLDAPARRRLLDEAVEAFRHNEAMFAALDRG